MKALFAVLGRDVARSLSPVMHEAAAWQVGLEMAYIAVPLEDREHFVRAVRALRVLGARGANVTMPYKEAAFAFVDRHTSEAMALGCVNTIRFEKTGTIGHNTDGLGLCRLWTTLPETHRHRVQVLGAGGAARAAIWAAREAGAHVTVCARRHAESLAARFGVRAGGLEPVDDVGLVINTIPPGAVSEARILDEWIDAAAKPFVLDLAYDLDTEPPLVRAARARGLPCEDGRRMLAEQGALSMVFWTGARVGPLRTAMLRSIGREPHFDSTSGQV